MSQEEKRTLRARSQSDNACSSLSCHDGGTRLQCWARSLSRSSARSSSRSKRGALYTVCSVGFFVPVILGIGTMIFQSAMTYYDQRRLDFVTRQVIEQFDTLANVDQNKFDRMLRALAAVNSLRVQGLRSTITSTNSGGEEIFAVKVTGKFESTPGPLSWNQSFQKVYNVRSSDLETFGYLAINAYPYCEINPLAGHSAYLPMQRASLSVSTWDFYQDNAIGSLRKSVLDKNDNGEENPENWKILGERLVSIY